MDMVVSIFRIENHEGKGPYCWDGITEEPGIYGKGYHATPVPDEDGIRGLTDDHYFGFSSARQMFTWFRQGTTRNIRNTEEWGIFLYRVPRENVIFGQRQVAFVKRSHVGVKRLV